MMEDEKNENEQKTLKDQYKEISDLKVYAYGIVIVFVLILFLIMFILMSLEITL